ncbi:hypothetical protein IEO21_04805 [Rhodonia placenta]|uniref:Uncharacterized protein n=1 Tax=Rhodonia placenta TaxID=104341 RepID=A0A8H7U267_9APHY|nr:hypothetical protein IEO21_04805 [Postia placenta]
MREGAMIAFLTIEEYDELSYKTNSRHIRRPRKFSAFKVNNSLRHGAKKRCLFKPKAVNVNGFWEAAAVERKDSNGLRRVL